jgi:hypothetical protein
MEDGLEEAGVDLIPYLTHWPLFTEKSAFIRVHPRKSASKEQAHDPHRQPWESSDPRAMHRD